MVNIGDAVKWDVQGLIPVGVSGPAVGERLPRRIETLGVWGAGLLGVLFALAFCPISAAWFCSCRRMAISSASVQPAYGPVRELPVKTILSTSGEPSGVQIFW